MSAAEKFTAVLLCLWMGTVLVAALISSSKNRKISKARAETEAARVRFEKELADVRASAEILIEGRKNQLRELLDAAIRHYESELRKAQEEVAPLRRLAETQAIASESEGKLVEALAAVDKLRADADALLVAAKAESNRLRAEANAKSEDSRRKIEATLAQASRDAVRIVAEANQRATEIGGDAYRALRESEALEAAIKAAENVIRGYGDKYVVPTRSVLDELASDFGHTEAGAALHHARERSRRMVLDRHAAECDYAESTRRDTAIRFVVDAFNGRVESILSRARNDNVGTLRQEIEDAAKLVNLNGSAFRNARITDDYVVARKDELRWAVVVQELKIREREEQRRIQEQIREEERARREYERAMREAQRDEDALKRAMEKAQSEVAHASAEQKAKYERQLAELVEKLHEAEARNQRAKSMAEQTRAGHVYIISNIGSFGEDVFKIGLTRRLEPMDRVRELGDASVPFTFDVHAMIYSTDAPTLERELHAAFENERVNRVNDRKEFFRVPISRLRQFVAERKLEAAFTMVAEAHEFRESKALERMTPEERERYHVARAERPERDLVGVGDD